MYNTVCVGERVIALTLIVDMVLHDLYVTLELYNIVQYVQYVL